MQLFDVLSGQKKKDSSAFASELKVFLRHKGAQEKKMANSKQ
jgi:hypothetical protein